MNPIFITAVVGLALICIFAWAALRQGRQAGTGDAEPRWQRVDMEAFLNLADPAEERYLRRNLSASEFAKIHRLRVRVMWEYLGRLAFNSKVMMNSAQMVQHNGTPEQLQSATRLVAAASRMRMLIFAVDAYLVVRFLLPQSQDPVRNLVGKYDELTQMFTQTCGGQLAYSQSVAS